MLFVLRFDVLLWRCKFLTFVNLGVSMYKIFITTALFLIISLANADSFEQYIARGNAYSDIGNFSLALKEYKNALTLADVNRDKIVALASLAAVAVKQDDKEQASAYVQQLLEIDPWNSWAESFIWQNQLSVDLENYDTQAISEGEAKVFLEVICEPDTIVMLKDHYEPFVCKRPKIPLKCYDNAEGIALGEILYANVTGQGREEALVSYIRTDASLREVPCTLAFAKVSNVWVYLADYAYFPLIQNSFRFNDLGRKSSFLRHDYQFYAPCGHHGFITFFNLSDDESRTLLEYEGAVCSFEYRDEDGAPVETEEGTSIKKFQKKGNALKLYAQYIEVAPDKNGKPRTTKMLKDVVTIVVKDGQATMDANNRQKARNLRFKVFPRNN